MNDKDRNLQKKKVKSVNGEIVRESKTITEEQLHYETVGYNNYKQRIAPGDYPDVVLHNIINHRDSIIAKYKDCAKETMEWNIGAVRVDGMMIPVDYDGAFVDIDDIFAAVYIADYKFRAESSKKEKYILWILFTNDPYIQVFPMICVQEISLKNRITKKIPNDYAEVIAKNCHCLKYPVCSVEEFEKIMEREQAIRGRVNKRMIMEQLYDAKEQIGLFESDTITCEIGGMSRAILHKMGYQIEE